MVPFAGVDTPQLLSSAMSVNREKHRILSSNIANVDTPHYNPLELDFQKTLKSFLDGRGRISLRKTQSAHIDKSTTRPVFDRLAFLSKNDYNKVDLEDQMAKMSDNTGQFLTYGSLLTKHFEQVKNMLTALR